MSDDRTKELGLYLNLIIRALLVAGKQGAPAEGLIPFNPLYFNMLRILQAEGRCRPSHLAEVLSVPRTTISTAVTSLVKRGIIQSEKDKDDGRAVVLSLTEQGSEVIAAIIRQDLRNAGAMLSALDDTEQKALLSALAKVSKHLSGPKAGG
ncbi:MarR family transcriptional regulator [Yoonia sp. SS1-5]|uniref:MarR family winged helix-turn-helix transcriptional regulator n=1 Tax=Yoonia rhodophyticola TaxID=3137370 RepID=A0AAN0ME06_9RHOB